MQAIVFNMSFSQFNRIMEANALKVGYLLGNEVILAGDTPIALEYREQMTGYSLTGKAGFLKQYFINHPHAFNTFERAERSFKMADKMKIRDSKLIAKKRKIETLMNTYWEALIDQTEEALDKLGFMVLKPFAAENTLLYLHISNTGMEGNRPGSIRGSELLQLLLIPGDEFAQQTGTPELFIFGNEFLSGNYQKPAILSPGDAVAVEAGSMYLQHLVTLPSLSHLTTSGLRQAREALQQPGAGFRQAVDEWCNLCYEGAEMGERLSLFTGKVMPLANSLQPFIDSNLHLQKEAGAGDESIQLWAGEMPVGQIWDYYHHFEALEEDTWQKLQQVKDEAEYKHQRWPVMMINMPDRVAEVHQVQQEIEPVRKYLKID